MFTSLIGKVIIIEGMCTGIKGLSFLGWDYEVDLKNQNVGRKYIHMMMYKVSKNVLVTCIISYTCDRGRKDAD